MHQSDDEFIDFDNRTDYDDIPHKSALTVSSSNAGSDRAALT